jgi:hypothetical protein
MSEDLVKRVLCRGNNTLADILKCINENENIFLIILDNKKIRKIREVNILEILSIYNCDEISSIEHNENIISMEVKSCESIERIAHNNKLTHAILYNLPNFYYFRSSHRLRTLDIRDCTFIHELPEGLENLESLHISNANIKHIPIYANLERLVCCKLRVIEIGTYKRLKFLDIINCESLIRVADQPRLISLVVECGIFELESFKELIYLRVSECNINIIPDLPKLRILGCINCNNLREISRLTKLKELYCYNNPKLIKINTFDNLRNLSLYSSNVIRVPHMPNLERLICTNSNNMRYIGNLDELAYFYFFNCKNLKFKNIGYMPKIKYDIKVFLSNVEYENMRVLRRLLINYLKSFTDIFINCIKEMLIGNPVEYPMPDYNDPNYYLDIYRNPIHDAYYNPIHDVYYALNYSVL